MATTTAPALTASAVADLVVGDLLLTGHGFGEAPAFVVRVGRFTAHTWTLVLTDGPDRTRTLTVWGDPTRSSFTRAPRANEDVSGLVDYDEYRDR